MCAQYLNKIYAEFFSWKTRRQSCL